MEHLRERGEALPANVAAVTFSKDETSTANTTIIKESTLNGNLINEYRKASNNPNLVFTSGEDYGDNAIRDEAGHTMGTQHESTDPNYKYGDLELGNQDSNNGELKLNQQDMQNCVNSCEFHLEK